MGRSRPRRSPGSDRAQRAAVGARGRQREALRARVRVWSERFERRLSGDLPFLLGHQPGIADVCAYPFLRYAVDAPAAGDAEPFQAILHELHAPGEHPGIDRWVRRMAALPRS